MRTPNQADVRKALRDKNLPIFGGRDFDITYAGIRTNIAGRTGQSSQVGDDFDDFFLALWEEHGQDQMLIVPATTDPGLYYLKKPINPKGTAIVVPGHYPGLWQKGPHGSKGIDALRQKGPVTVWRDRDRDNYLDMGPGVRKERGLFWINGHPASYRRNGQAHDIGRWGAGCQVTKAYNDHRKMMRLRDEQIRRYGVNSFSYSLITALDF